MSVFLALRVTGFCDDKSLVMGDILLEDSVPNCKRWLERNIDGQVILFPSAMHNHEGGWHGLFRLLEERNT